ncbi:MAG: YraN family protein [Bacteroidia bacterium]
MIKTKFVPQTLQTGRQGEERAVAFLREHGYQIEQINWRHKHLEIDIIAKKDDFLVIIEVKTRKNDDFGAPEVFVDKKKQRKIIRATHEYILQQAVENEVRFDIVAINNKTGHIEHIQRAFYPDLS